MEREKFKAWNESGPVRDDLNHPNGRRPPRKAPVTAFSLSSSPLDLVLVPDRDEDHATESGESHRGRNDSGRCEPVDTRIEPW